MFALGLLIPSASIAEGLGFRLADCGGDGGDGGCQSSCGAEITEGTAQKAAFPDFSLTLVRNHMIRRHPDMDASTIELAESEYRKFLKTCKESPGQSIVPGHLADKFWHAHILHTKLYMADCQAYFGYYLHHTPKVMDVKEPCALGECFCNGEIQGGGFDASKLLEPTESCG